MTNPVLFRKHAPIVLDTTPRELTLARWGFTPKWSKDVHEGARHVNARAEGLAERRLFKDSLVHARCLVPCDGFYEWKHHGKQSTPLHVHVPQHPIQTMAGLWTSWRSPDGIEVVTFTIVTRAADEFMSRIHTRMPVFIAPEARDAWLSKDATPALIDGLLHSASPSFAAFEVAAHVNRAGVDDARCLEPAAAVQLELL